MHSIWLSCMCTRGYLWNQLFWDLPQTFPHIPSSKLTCFEQNEAPKYTLNMLIGVLENQLLADRLYEKYTFIVLSTWSQFYLIRGLIYIVTYCMSQSHF